jgi:hypothetical protein
VRAVALWLALFGIYAATLPVHAAEHGARYSDAEAHALLAARSMAKTGNVDLSDDYRDAAWHAFRRTPLRHAGALVDGRYVEPTGLGYPALAAPAYLADGATGVVLESAALLALAFVLAVALARRLVPEPWATGGVLAVAISVPALAAATSATPQPAAAAALTGAALLAVRARERPGRRVTVGAAFLLGLLPWLSPALIVPAAAVGFALVRWVARSRRPVRAVAAAEVVLTMLVTYVAVNEGLFGGLTPVAARADGTFAHSAGGYADRLDRIVGALLDRSIGALRWAPVLVLALYAVWLLWRSRRDRLARAIVDQAEVESIAGMTAGVVGAGLLAAALLSPLSGLPAYPARALVPVLPLAGALVAWALRHAPRTGAALAALTALASGWLLVALATGAAGGWADPGEHPPWGALLPRFGDGPAGAVVSAVAAAALLALVVSELRRKPAANVPRYRL